MKVFTPLSLFVNNTTPKLFKYDKSSDRSIYRHDNKRSFFPRASLYQITAIEKNPLAPRCSHPLRRSSPLRRTMKLRRLQWSEEKFAAGARRSKPPQEGASVDLSRDSWWSLGLCRKNENEAEKWEKRIVSTTTRPPKPAFASMGSHVKYPLWHSFERTNLCRYPTARPGILITSRRLSG